ncbi:hypothetical protein Bache_0627 [Bacteroides helcogenes P 36-108]|uniref:Uncharacterized protein n=1 Tax=Bacteroides helcogenes (strain ATCC 35417 / DSM 20613 / JCM 6297 / CCUG 15421 / P 36-108) TaxID=693979 RepID=E6SMT6_BACT6|nr:hypothetical protein Bache_0627 [Bacteroides helcogenes P 36-108]
MKDNPIHSLVEKNYYIIKINLARKRKKTVSLVFTFFRTQLT